MTKNKKIIVLLSVLILGIGVSLAYFVGKTLFQGDGAKTKVTTANINGATIEIEGRLNFNAKDMLPGHKDVSRIDVKATGDNILVSYNVIYKEITNTLKTKLKYTVYKVTELQDVTSNCNRKSQNVAGGQMVYEECEISNIDKLGSPVGEGTITNTQEILVQDEFINASPTGEKVSYYVIIEYPNEANDQSYDNNGVFSGEVTIGESDAEPDINIIGIYVEDKETGKFEPTNKMPSNGIWQLNEQSICNNEAKPAWDYINQRFYIDKLTQSGTSCVLYFEEMLTPESMLAKLNEARTKSGGKNYTIEKLEAPMRKSEELSENKIYSYPEGNGTTYLFRGNVQDNWLNFAGHTWRIIRINSDGTLRLIYQCGSTDCQDTTGDNTQIGTSAYKLKPYDDNTYVGYYYGTPESDYITTHKSLITNPSTIATAVKHWYNGDGNMTNYTKYISGSTGFCNDRSLSTAAKPSGFEGDGTGTQATAYGAMGRLLDTNWAGLTGVTPSLNCSSNDLFTYSENKGVGNGILEVPAALITADEVALAGMLAGDSNAVTSNWLNTNKYYWTMSPRYGTIQASVFFTNSNGALSNSSSNTDLSIGVRPVINLKSNITLEPGGNGTVGNPYVVVTE